MWNYELPNQVGVEMLTFYCRECYICQWGCQSTQIWAEKQALMAATVLPQPIISRDFYFCNDVISWCTLALQRSSRRCVSQPCVGGYQSGGGDIRVVKVVEKELVTTLLKFCCPPLPKLMGEPACSLAVKDDLK